MRTSNPTLSPEIFRSASRERSSGDVMTIQGTINATAILMCLALLTAGWSWKVFYTNGPAAVSPYLMVGAIGGFICALATAFKPMWAKITAPLYALLEGFFIGGLSSVMEASYPGIVIQATMLTFGTMAALLVAYRSGWIHVTDKLRMGIVAATGAIALVYFLSMILGFFGVHMSMIHGATPLGIGFSLIVVGVAALNLVLDFDLIDRGSKAGAPAYMDWYAAFGLMVTLIWLYIEILRLLSKLRERR